MSSGGMYTAPLTVDHLQLDADHYKGSQQYALAKRAQVTLNELWAERHPDREVVFHALHPGWADTPGVVASLPTFHRVMGPLLRNPDEGADTLVWLAADDGEPVTQTGGFWLDRRVRPIHRLRSTKRSDTPERRARAVGLGGRGQRRDRRRHRDRPLHGRRSRRARPRHRRDRLHRRAAGRRAARRRLPGALPRADPGQARRRALVGPGRGGAGRRARATSPRRAATGVDAVYYLVHTIGGSSRLDRAATGRRPRTSATPRPRPASRRIVYLGGLGDEATEELSPHLASRHEVGRVLADGPVPVTELRAAVIIGSGSASFEMLRYLVERAAGDGDAALGARPGASRSRSATCCATSSACSAGPTAAGRVLEIGGPDVLSYGEMMQHLRRGGRAARAPPDPGARC